MWGVITTLTMDAYGKMKAMGENTITSVLTTFGMIVLNPLDVVWNLLG